MDAGDIVPEFRTVPIQIAWQDINYDVSLPGGPSQERMVFHLPSFVLIRILTALKQDLSIV
jgi:hypothetical protein